MLLSEVTGLGGRTMNSKTGTAGLGQEVCFSQSPCDTRDTVTAIVRKLNQTRVHISKFKDF